MTLLDSSVSKVDAALLNGFKGAMGLLTGGVTVITTGVSAEDRRGLTATAVCSLSADPPMVLISMNRSGEARTAVTRAGHFCVNVLSQDDREVADVFAGRHGHQGSSKFDVGNWEPIVSGVPALATALVAIDCEVVEKVESYTHTIFFGLVHGLRFHAGGGADEVRTPLVYWDRLYRQIT